MADERQQHQRSGGNAPAPQQPAAQGADWQDEVTIEIDAPRNANVGFGPERTFLRGQWRRERLLADEVASDEVKYLPDMIPGMRITLNGRTKEGRIWDPLALPENQPMLERLTQSHQRVMRQPAAMAARMGPVPEAVRKLDPGRFKTWLYHMNQLVQEGQATLVSGRFPRSEVQEALAGKTEIECWATRSVRDRKYLEDQPKVAVA